MFLKMKMFAGALTLASFVVCQVVVATPVPSKHSKSSDNKERILYDQRQEGEWNIRADLKNFVILIIPKSSEPQDTSSGAGLLDLLTRSHGKYHGKHGIKKPQEGGDVAAETMHFIESKTAPYHVDITKSSSHLMNDEILATQSPPIALKTADQPEKPENPSLAEPAAAALLRQLRSTRLSKAFVLTVPDEEFILSKTEDDKKVVKKDGFKKKVTKKNKEEWALIGAVEQCGPGLVRDAEGICRLRNALEGPEGGVAVDKGE